MMSKSILIVHCFLFFSSSVCMLAQKNLVLNHGFEEERYKSPAHWMVLGTVDYYRDSVLFDVKITPNEPSPVFPKPDFGRRYIGIRAFEDATEVIVGRFTTPLEKDKWYKLSCYVRRPAVDCKLSVPGISVFLSDTICKNTSWYGYNKKIPYILLFQNTQNPPALIDNFNEWTKVSTYYLAKGGERFLWVGNFMGANEKLIRDYIVNNNAVAQSDGILRCAYHYYYDEFSLEETTSPVEHLITIRDVLFDSGNSNVVQVNDSQLIYLAEVLNQNRKTRVIISGHTDSDGNDASNVNLSLQRAKAIAQWLTLKGIESSRMSCKGEGELKPVAPNDTPENKAKNRRVEILLVDEGY